MGVNIDEVTSTVETEAPAPGPASAPVQPSPDEADRNQRDMARRMRRDGARTRSEAYDD